jgi:hypothetical protein
MALVAILNIGFVLKSQILMWYVSGGHNEYWIGTKITNSNEESPKEHTCYKYEHS